MAIVQVQKKSNVASAATVTTTFDAPPTQNNLLIAVVQERGTISGDPTVTGFTLAGTVTTYNSGARRTGIFYKVAGAGEASAVVANGVGTPASMDLHIFEYSGMATSSMLDQTATDGLNSATTVTSRTTGTTGATAQADELAIVAVGFGNTVTALSWSNGFGVELNTGRLSTGSKILSATGTQESTASWTTAREAGGVIATFKAASGTVARSFGLGVGASLPTTGPVYAGSEL